MPKIFYNTINNLKKTIKIPLVIWKIKSLKKRYLNKNLAI